MPDFAHCSIIRCTSTSGRNKSPPSSSSMPSKNCTRTRRSSSSLCTFSATAITKREAKILFSTTSVPTSSKLLADSLAVAAADFRVFVGSRHARQVAIVPSTHSGRNFLYAIQTSRRVWLSRALAGSSISVVSWLSTAAPISTKAFPASPRKRSRSARVNFNRGLRMGGVAISNQ